MGLLGLIMEDKELFSFSSETALGIQYYRLIDSDGEIYLCRRFDTESQREDFDVLESINSYHLSRAVRALLEENQKLKSLAKSIDKESK